MLVSHKKLGFLKFLLRITQGFIKQFIQLRYLEKKHTQTNAQSLTHVHTHTHTQTHIKIQTHTLTHIHI